MKNYRFKSIPKGGHKGMKGQTKRVRVGSRFPGSTNQGSVRRPF
jgi:hypothetical protein